MDKPSKDLRPENDPAFEGYLVTDEYHETVRGLEHLSHLFGLVQRDRYLWKWIILCAHGTLQNAAVCLLTGTSGLGALDKRSERQILERFNGDWESKEPWPRERLAEFPELMRRVSEKTSLNYPAKPDWKKFDKDTDIVRLHIMRNDFVHYTAKSWLVELDGLPRILLHSLSVIEELVASSNYSAYNRFQEVELDPFFSAIRAEIAVIERESSARK